jgi:DNA (cytosine-5)-methyltransferase 1
MKNQNGAGCDCVGSGGHVVTFLDLFSGIGGMRLSFEKACLDSGITPICVGFSEVDKHAIATYLRHYPGTPELGDITALAASNDIPECDVVLAGFCCQAFSKAGKKGGFEDTRGTLFFSLAAILEAKKPQAFLFENVENLVHHDKGRTLKRILEILEQLGYRTRWKVLNSQDFGVPQSRERVFLVGFREGGNGFQFPAPTDSTKILNDILEAEPVPARHYLSEQYVAGMRRHKARHEAKGNGFGYQILDQEADVSSTLVCGGMGRDRNLIVDRRIAEYGIKKENGKGTGSVAGTDFATDK